MRSYQGMPSGMPLRFAFDAGFSRGGRKVPPLRGWDFKAHLTQDCRPGLYYVAPPALIRWRRTPINGRDITCYVSEAQKEMETFNTHGAEVHAAQTETAPTPGRPSPARQNGRWAGYAHLLLARMRELKREPEVIFWVFVFPLLLALGLGIAFRNKPADVAPVAVVAGPGAQRALDLLQASPQHAAIHADLLDAALALKGFRLGKYARIIEPRPDGSFQYR